MKQWRSDGAVRRPAAAALAVLTLAVAVAGGRPDRGFAESNVTGPGFSRAKLERVGELFRNEIATGKIPGAILLIQQHVFDVEADHVGGRDDAGR